MRLWVRFPPSVPMLSWHGVCGLIYQSHIWMWCLSRSAGNGIIEAVLGSWWTVSDYIQCGGQCANIETVLTVCMNLYTLWRTVCEHWDSPRTVCVIIHCGGQCANIETVLGQCACTYMHCGRQCAIVDPCRVTISIQNEGLADHYTMRDVTWPTLLVRFGSG